MGMAISMAETAIKTATTEHVVAGRKCNIYVLNDMPVGKYDANYGTDQNGIAGKPYIKVTVK